jgi:hypothetical protein
LDQEHSFKGLANQVSPSLCELSALNVATFAQYVDPAFNANTQH